MLPRMTEVKEAMASLLENIAIDGHEELADSEGTVTERGKTWI